MVLGSRAQVVPFLSDKSAITSSSSSSSSSTTIPCLTRRRATIISSLVGVAVGVPSLLRLCSSDLQYSSCRPALAEQKPEDELQREEDRVVHIFQETSPSVVFIKDLAIAKSSKGSSSEAVPIDDKDTKLEGTGSGFIWDKFGHIVTNYHVIAKLATDQSGLQRCKVLLVDATGSSFVREGKIIGFDTANDLAVLKVNIDGHQVKPAVLGTSHDLRVGQSCFAIGNPYGYENTLTTGVVSGLGREIPSPIGSSIRGAVQTDAAINSGNSGGPLIDSHGYVIGVNTATFTRRGTGLSSGVNFAIPVDTVVRTVPYLIVYGTPYSNRF
ncbi:hypothetical protein NL676_008868 [Syzygium grande]|nr:hypothetical protein NL676_008868 [Syzygium grande]